MRGRRVVPIALLVWHIQLSPAPAQDPAPDPTQKLVQELQQLKQQLEEMKAGYERRIAALESKVTQLQARSITAPEAGAPVPTRDVSFTGGERTLQKLNPEISATGDVTGRFSDNHESPDFNRLKFDGFEMAIQHPLDPFSQAKFFITGEDEDGEIAFSLEEGYVSWESLPGNLGVKLGRFHTNFGKLNRYHKHALPWADRDLPTRTLFGNEGLIGNGISLNWLPPKLPFAQTNEISFEVINNSTDRAFSGRGFADPLFVGRLQSYYDLTDNAYFEWGVSAATSHWDLEKKHRSVVTGLDLSYRWEPLRRALYRSLEVRSEFFYDLREEWPGGDIFGLYASGQYQLNRRWYAGLRYQYGQRLENNDDHEWSLGPILTFWQSEWVRLRAQYDFVNRNFDNRENRLFLQLTWALGPHKHEAY